MACGRPSCWPRCSNTVLAMPTQPMLAAAAEAATGADRGALAAALDATVEDGAAIPADATRPTQASAAAPASASARRAPARTRARPTASRSLPAGLTVSRSSRVRKRGFPALAGGGVEDASHARHAMHPAAHPPLSAAPPGTEGRTPSRGRFPYARAWVGRWRSSAKHKSAPGPAVASRQGRGACFAACVTCPLKSVDDPSRSLAIRRFHAPRARPGTVQARPHRHRHHQRVWPPDAL